MSRDHHFRNRHSRGRDSRGQDSLADVPDCNEALRRLSDVLLVPLECRKRACRREGSCQGGYGPPCYFERRAFFADMMRDGLDDYRDYWEEERQQIAALERRR